MIVTNLILATLITLVDGGVAKCRVVTAADASRPEAFGAREIEKYFAKATGCGELNGPLTVSVSVDPGQAGLKEDGFVLEATSDGVSIIGQNPRGALYGCYELLKRHAGMRWIVPGDDGEYCVHEGRTVAVPVGRTVRNPYLRIRETRANTVEGFLWHARNNMLSEMPTSRFFRDGKPLPEAKVFEELAVRGIGTSGHILSNLLIGNVSGKERERKRDELFAVHPEWFPLIKGERIKIIGSWDANPCVSNPALLDRMAENLIALIAGPHGCESYVTIGNNDTTIWCECDKCRALDAPERKGTPGALSDRYWHMVGGIASRVWKQLPAARLGGWAYQNYWYPPVRTPIDPRLKVFVSFNNQCWRHAVDDPVCTINAEWRKIYAMWAERKLPLVVNRDAIGNIGCPANTYEPAERILRANFRAYAKYGCGGSHFVVMGAQPDFFKWDNRWPFWGKNLGWYAMWQTCYLSANCMWDIDCDFEALLEEANRLYYGKAWEGGFREFRAFYADCFFSTPGCIGWASGAPLGRVLDRAGSEEKLTALLEKAIACAKADGDERSLRHLLRDREIFEKTVLDARRKYLAEFKEMNVYRRRDELRIDGSLEDPDWKNADAYQPPNVPRTSVRVVYDTDNLYFAVENLDGKDVAIRYNYPDMAERFNRIVLTPRQPEIRIPCTDIGMNCFDGATWKMIVGDGTPINLKFTAKRGEGIYGQRGNEASWLNSGFENAVENASLHRNFQWTGWKSKLVPKAWAGRATVGEYREEAGNRYLRLFSDPKTEINQYFIAAGKGTLRTSFRARGTGGVIVSTASYVDNPSGQRGYHMVKGTSKSHSFAVTPEWETYRFETVKKGEPTERVAHRFRLGSGAVVDLDDVLITPVYEEK